MLTKKKILNLRQINTLRADLKGFQIAVSFGSGVDSTAMLVALHEAGITPDVITFADTGGEKPETLEHLHRMNKVLQSWSWPLIKVCKRIPLASTNYTDLYGNCWSNQTLPSLAFGMKSCSIKWKQDPQDYLIKGARSGPNACQPHPVWNTYQETGQRIAKLIGYDCGKADIRRSKKLPMADDDFDFIYPLQLIKWQREDCIHAITQALGAYMVPIKSACYYCPASKPWELFWLAAYHPDLLEKALRLEYRALTGKHSRFDAVEFGTSWDELVKNADSFPSTKTTVGLGRSFSWNQWARVNSVVDKNFKVLRSSADQDRFGYLAEQMRGQGEDNAQDVRNSPGKRIIPIAVSFDTVDTI